MSTPPSVKCPKNILLENKSKFEKWLDDKSRHSEKGWMRNQQLRQELERLVLLSNPKALDLLTKQQRKDWLENCLLSVGENRQIPSNWGHWHAGPSLALTVNNACKLILTAEKISEAAITHEHYGQKYLDGHQLIRRGITGLSILHLSLSLGHLYKDSRTFGQVLTESNLKGDALFFASVEFLGHGTDFAHDIFEEGDRLTFVSKTLQKYKKLGYIGSALNAVSVLALGASSAKSIFDGQAPNSVKALAATEAGLNLFGSITASIAMTVWLDRVRKAAALAEKTGNAALPVAKTLPIIGLISAIVATFIKPMEVYGIVKEYEYAANLDKLAAQFSAHGYDGHALLAKLYKSKAIFDTAVVATQSTLNLIGGAASVALMSSLITMPLGIAIGVITSVLSIVVDTVSQPILESLAGKQKDAILAWEQSHFGKNYFEHQLDAYYIEAQPRLVAFLKDTQKKFGVDQVISITHMQSDMQAHELAALTKLTDKTRSGKTYIDLFKEDAFIDKRNISLDVSAGVIDLHESNVKQALVFTTPLATPGKEDHIRTQKGKNSYITQLKHASTYVWEINDKGIASSTLIDLAKVVQRVKKKDGTIKEITVKANLGEGDDLVIASNGPLLIDGESGNDMIDYSALTNTCIRVRTEANGDYVVSKTLKNGDAYEERTIEEQINYGKRKEVIEYRKTLLTTIASSETTDRLMSIEHLVGTRLSDAMVGGDRRDIFYGDAGDDQLFGMGGDDILSGGQGNDQLSGGEGNDYFRQNIDKETDRIDGGAGVDVVDYSATKFKVTDLPSGAKGVYVDLATTRVTKYIYPIKNGAAELASDELKNIENVIGTERKDEINGDGQANLLIGLAGADILRGLGGEDVLVGGEDDDALDGGDDDDELHGGSGKDSLKGGKGRDKFIQENVDGDDMDGGEDEDTVDYIASKAGVIVNLLRGVIRSSADKTTQPVEDRVKNIEHVIGTVFDDEITGDRHNNRLDGAEGDNTINGGGGDDDLLAGNGNNTVKGASGHDVIRLGNGNNHVDSGGGDNYIHVGDGNNVLNAGGGKDIIFVGKGLNTIHSGAGDDLIRVRALGVGKNVIDGGAGIDLLHYSDVQFDISGEEEGIYADLYAGYVIKRDWLGEHSVAELSARDEISHIEGIVGTTRRDVLKGDDQDNLLSAGAGDDLLEGRRGNDILIGGAGSDRYLFSRGDGVDKIIEDDATLGNKDVLQFGPGSTKEQLWFSQAGENNQDLIVSILDTEDLVSIKNWFSGEQYHIEKIELSNGVTLDHRQVDGLVQALAKFVPVNGWVSSASLADHQPAWTAVLASSWGS
ncbi:MAG: hypothetical protein IT497_02165 [Ottowia sp.]|nr:hypothetical protein [Ottowia sp.]